MKRVIINENALNNDKISEVVLIDELPESLKTALYRNKTSLGNNPAIPDEYDDNILSKMTIERLNESKKSLLELGNVETESSNLSSIISEITKKCQKIEYPLRERLEKIAYNKIIEMFEPPEGVLNFSVSLVDNISDSDISVRVQSEDSDFEFDDISQKSNLLNEVYKRRIIDALIMGFALRYSYNIGNYIKDIYEVDKRLPLLYEQGLKINDYTLFYKGEIKLTDDMKNQAGINSVMIGNDTVKTDINVKALSFPILLIETIRAFMEVFAAHGLPKKKSEALYVMEKADFLQAEQWDMRLGPALWDRFEYCLGECSTKILPYVFMRYCMLPVDKFNELTKEILIKSKKGKKILNFLKNKSIKNKDHFDFKNRMKKNNDRVSVISDGFIHPNEL